MPDLKTELEKVTRAESALLAEPKRRQHTTSSCTPVLTKKLAERVGNLAETSRMLGYSSGYLQTAFSRNEVAAVAEIAAKGLLAELDRREGKTAQREFLTVIGRIPGMRSTPSQPR